MTEEAAGTGLAHLTLAEVAALRWRVDPGSPRIGPPPPSPVVADPTFLPPQSTPDGRWWLWAHALQGVYAWTSDDGLSWRRRRRVVGRALRAHVVDLLDAPGASRRPDRYRLAYERTRVFLPVGVPWRSWLESRRSADLAAWSPPSVLLRPSLPWHRSGRLGEAVSNPCLVPLPDGSWRLYYSAGLTWLPDCGFTEPTAIGVAHGPGPDGPFVPDPEPLLRPDQGDTRANLAAGALKVLPAADGWVGLHNVIGIDGGRTSGELRLLGSSDGLSWAPLGDGPVLAPTGHGWMSDFVYACDLRRTDDGLRLWFNARRGHRWWAGREALGFADAVAASGPPRP